MNGPNRCAVCPRTACTLFSPAEGQPATHCGQCAVDADPCYFQAHEQRSELRRDTDTDLCAALAQANRRIADLTGELSRVRRALINAHEANADLYDYTGGGAR
jgi:hypothetical protein